MMNFDGQDVGMRFSEAFDREISTITPTQMRWLVNFAKHVRGRCRNNTALKNYLSRNFHHLEFKEVMDADMDYPRMVITERES